MSIEKNKVKIGARALSTEAFHKLLPNNEEIFTRIEDIREFAYRYKKEKEESRQSYNNDLYRNYLSKELDRNQNNIFSILGGRGSGKTSVLLTIKNRITNKNTTDIMLPLIVPENMGDSSDILGWTICAFEKIILDIERYIYENRNINNSDKHDFFKNCRKNDNNILRKKFSELLKYYTYVNKEYRQILNLNYDGFNDYKEKTKEVVNAERELLNKFEEFIDILVEVKKDLLKVDKEVLIYIFFDDVDLSTERCLEIISIILKYLSNSNIVVFVSGDYATFSETLTINLLKKDGLLKNSDKYFYKEENMGGKNALDIRRQLAQDILKKALPPAYRFKMPILNNKAKAEFKFSTPEDDNSNEEEKYQNLLQLINTKLLNSKKDNTYNFLFYQNNLIEIYFNIFDSNPRSLMNIYYFLYGLEEYKGEKTYCEVLKAFLNIIIDSNPQLENMANQIVTYIIDIKDDLNETFINYQYIKELYDNESKLKQQSGTNYNSKKLLDKYINIFLLAHFIENIIATKIQRNIHGINIFIEMINKSNENKLIPKHNDSNFILALYSKINKTLGRITSNKFSTYEINYFTKTYFEILFELVGEKSTDILNQKDKSNKIRDVFLPSIRQQDGWAIEKIDIIFKATCNSKDLFIKAINKSYDTYVKNLDIETRYEISYMLLKLYNEYANKIDNLGKKKSISIGNFMNVSIGVKTDFYYIKQIEIKNNLYIKDIKNLDETIRIVKEAMNDIHDELFYNENLKNGIVYEMPKLFIKKFNELWLEFNELWLEFDVNEVENIQGKMDIINHIIESRNNREISIDDYQIIKRFLRDIQYDKFVRGDIVKYSKEFNYLLKMTNDFEKKDVVIFKNINQLENLIKENVLLRFSIDMLKRRKYIDENKNVYNDFIKVKKVLSSVGNPLLKRIIREKQNELEQLKIQKEKNEEEDN
ncbi:hypothetical protein G8S49_09790 [Clostridium botulinum C]|uniref:KAP NTPase domain-containing protein n=2 Tax=Clostridium botulinum TaxID=1491 RepID=A0A9Q4TLU6_CLOBO|nr:hypothetical protein [Clostridium botulinum]EGO88592.1 hypothetical protein CBCST_04436 [Clostridium botulinum C str. Stockholm]MCD3195551.1 hypothetical protein [Clostridium botulinum C]MCD3200967.1 hypothetical protein [Clostridium botulinum C]MCD3206375.1 hypothetical protein [Clostridium botulinum C]MCD3208827.1 hypothetical protein [Clostridium botulinum C]